jgi:hypothetical protein
MDAGPKAWWVLVNWPIAILLETPWFGNNGKPNSSRTAFLGGIVPLKFHAVCFGFFTSTINTEDVSLIKSIISVTDSHHLFAKSIQFTTLRTLSEILKVN